MPNSAKFFLILENISVHFGGFKQNEFLLESNLHDPSCGSLQFSGIIQPHRCEQCRPSAIYRVQILPSRIPANLSSIARQVSRDQQDNHDFRPCGFPEQSIEKTIQLLARSLQGRVQHVYERSIFSVSIWYNC